MSKEVTVAFLVATSFTRDTDGFATLEEARAYCGWLNDGYLNGTLFASDPKPMIFECRPVARYAAGVDSMAN